MMTTLSAITETLSHLVIEQTSPQEIVLFVATCVGLLVLVSLSLYGAMVTLVWLLGYRNQIGLGALLFPSGVKDYGVELALSAVTTGALLLTFSAKEDVLGAIKHEELDGCVQQIQACQRVREPVSATSIGSDAVARPPCVCDLAALFPNETIPNGLEDQMVTRLASASGAYTVSELLKPVIDAGGADQAGRFVRAMLPSVRQKLGGRAQFFFTTDGDVRDPMWLVVFCGFAAIFHIVWLAVQRFSAVEQVGVEFYGGTVRKLAMLATCIALLLIAPSVVQDEELVTNAAVASVRVSDPPDDETLEALSSNVRDAIQEQRGSRAFVASLVDIDGVKQELARMRMTQANHISVSRAQSLEQRARLDAVPQQRLQALAALEARQSTNLDALGGELRAWYRSGLASAIQGVSENASSALRQAVTDLREADATHRQQLDEAIVAGDERLREELARRVSQLGAGFVTTQVHERDLGSLQQQVGQQIVQTIGQSEQRLRGEITSRTNEAEGRMRTYHDRDKPAPQTRMGALVVTTPEERAPFNLGEQQQWSLLGQPWARLLPPAVYYVNGKAIRVAAGQVAYHQLGYTVR